MRCLPSARAIGCSAAALIFAWIAGAAIAAEPLAEVPQRVTAGLDLTVDSLEARVRKVEASQIDPDSRAEAIAQYQAAIEQLHRASEWQARSEALRRLQREAPSILDSARKQIDNLARQPAFEVAGNSSISDLELDLSEAEASLGVVRKALADVDSEQKLLSERRLEVPTELAQAGGYNLLGDVELPPLPTGSIETLVAQQARRRADERVVSRQAEALELELATHEIHREVLAARRDLYRRQFELRTATVGAIQKAISDRRAKEAQDALEEARSVQAVLARAHPVLGRLAEESAELAAERSGPEGLANRIQRNSEALTAVTKLVSELTERARSVRQKAEAANFSDAVGLILRKERAELPAIDEVRGRIRARRSAIAESQFALLTLEDLREGLPALENEVDGILAEQEKAIGKLQRVRLEASAREVLKTRGDYLDDLIRDYNSYFGVLVDLDARERQLVDVASDYRSFLDEHVLWIRSTSWPRWRSLSDAAHAAAWLADPRNVRQTLKRIVAVAQSPPLSVTLVALIWSLLLLYRSRLRRFHDRLCETQGSDFRGPMLAAIAALGAVALVSLIWPMLVWLVILLIEAATSVIDDYSRALVAALAFLAIRIASLEFVRRVAARRGIARRFLNWPEQALTQIRRQAIVVETLVLPAFAVSALFFTAGNEPWSDSLGRLGFVAGHVVLMMACYRLVLRAGPIGPVVLRRGSGDMRKRLRYGHWLPLVVGGANIALALIGYYFSAYELTVRVWRTLALLAAVALVNTVALRWIAGARQNLARRQLAERLAPPAQSGEVEGEGDEEIDLYAIDMQTRQLVRVVVGAVAVVSLFLVWVDVIPALRVLDRIDLWTVTAQIEQTTGNADALSVRMVDKMVPVTLANVLIAIVALLLSVTASRNLPGFIEMTLLQRARLDAGLRYAITTVCRYAITVIGTVTVFRNLGVAWSHVQWLVAAVSVGLGFGLQEIFGNFVSGLILLFERPVRVGDTVTLGGVSGTVSKIRMRATTILDWDRKELVVPNKEFITGQLVNWSLSDATVRLVIPVGVAYGSDTAQVEKLLYEIARETTGVLADPAPLVVMVRFGDSTLDFELRVFVESPDSIVHTRHRLLLAVDSRFRAAGIEIAFPQRDLHLRSVSGPIVVEAPAVRPPS